MDALTWLKGLLAAVISSVSTTVLATVGANATGSPLNWTQIANVAGFSALVGGLAYLKQSPIPTELYSVTQTTTTTATSIPLDAKLNDKMEK